MWARKVEQKLVGANGGTGQTCWRLRTLLGWTWGPVSPARPAPVCIQPRLLFRADPSPFKPRRVGLLTASAVRPPAKDAVLAEPSYPTKSRRGDPRLANDATPNPETRRLLYTPFLL